MYHKEPLTTLRLGYEDLAPRIRAHWPLIPVLCAGIILRALAIAAVRPALLFYGDSFYYVENARNLLPKAVRPAGYGFFLRHTLLASGRLELVVLLQHLMGLGIGVLTYALMRRFGVKAIFAAVAAAPMMLDAYQVNIEHYIMPEALFQFLAFTGVALLVWRKSPTLLQCLAGGALIATAALTRSVGVVLVVPIALYAIIQRIGLIRLVAVAGAMTLPLMSYAHWFGSTQRADRKLKAASSGIFGIEGFGGHFLYGRIMPIADCSRVQVPAYEQPLCDDKPPQMRYGPNYYVWDKGSPSWTLHLPPGMDVDKVLTDFSLRVIRRQPREYVRMVVSNVVHMLAPGRKGDRLGVPASVWQFSGRQFENRSVRGGVADIGPPVVDPTVRPSYGRALAWYQHSGYTPGPLIAGSIIVALIGAVIGRGARRTLRPEAFLFASLAGVMIVAPVATTMFDYRYLLPALPFVGPAAVIGATQIAWWFSRAELVPSKRVQRYVAVIALCALFAACGDRPRTFETFGSPRPVTMNTWSGWCRANADLKRLIDDMFGRQILTRGEFISRASNLGSTLDDWSEVMREEGASDLANGTAAIANALGHLKVAYDRLGSPDGPRRELNTSLGKMRQC